jgi:hypothetical protein
VSHLALLGDSIFDNARYVPGGPSVVEHLRRILPGGWRVTLLAIDGSVAADVPRQLERVPADVSHLIVSAGGNDGLDQSGLILHEPAGSFAEVLARMADLRGEFRQSYQRMLQHVLGCGKPTGVCTVYDAIPGLDPSEAAALSLFNDVILREAFRAGVPVIDLRLICHEPTDYSRASPIEPSVSGGGKIARAIARLLAAPVVPAGEGRVIV